MDHDEGLGRGVDWYNVGGGGRQCRQRAGKSRVKGS